MPHLLLPLQTPLALFSPFIPLHPSSAHFLGTLGHWVALGKSREKKYSITLYKQGRKVLQRDVVLMLHLTCLRGKAACLTFDRPGHILLLAETINKLRWPQSWLRKGKQTGKGVTLFRAWVLWKCLVKMDLLQLSAGKVNEGTCL